MTHQPAAPTPQADEGAGAYEQLMSTLEAGDTRYRLIEHAPEGRTERVSALRGHPAAQAAKCLVVMVKIGKRTSRYFLAVVPGDVRTDLPALKALAGGTYVGIASAPKAEALAGSISGTILPFSFHPDLELVVDPGLLRHTEIYFNAARLDRSVALDTRDYLRIADPKVHPIATAPVSAAPAADLDPPRPE